MSTLPEISTNDRRIARILSGVQFFLTKFTAFFTRRFQNTVHFFPTKIDDFFNRRLQKGSKTTDSSSKYSCHSKKYPKNWLLLRLGVHLQIFPVNYA